MAATAVSTVLSKFGELAVSEGRLLVQVGDKMMLMRDRLEWLQAFIRDADRKRRTGTDGLSSVWLRQTRDVAFQVEDALDEFFRKVDLESQGYQGWKKWSKYLAGCWTQVAVRHVMSDRLDKINSRLQQISENQKEYNIEHTPLVALTSSTAASAAWRDERDDMVGFDDDVKSLEKMLLRTDHLETMFISIIGESGVGKSTLANIIYKLPVRGSEGVKYITLLLLMEPDSFPEEVVQTLYYTLFSVEDTDPVAPVVAVETGGAGPVGPVVAVEKGVTDQAGKLRELLSDKLYRLVLGGITSIPMFNLLTKCLPNNNNGSSVVLVLDAENEEVALHANKRNQDGMNGIHLVTHLDKEKSAELFRSKALRKEQVSEDGRKYEETVFGITGGHRLSIVILAGLLRFKEKPLQWEAVLLQLTSEVGAGEGEQQLRLRANLSITTAMERIFWTCFEDLPNDIKSCFLYLVTVGKNLTVQANVIVLMWIGEGFIKSHKGKTMEEVGRGYMKELALRCLVQVQSRNDVGGIVEIRVHGSLHGFLLSEAREAGFMEIHDIHDAFVPPSVRRLSFQIYGGRYSRFTNNNKFPKLRSFVSLGKRELDGGNIRVDSTGAEKELYNLKFLLASKFLRVLFLGGGQRVNALPEEIGNLLELRCICIDSPELKELPASVKRLLNLQTLVIGGCGVERIDTTFWKIKTLRHVVASGCLTLPESLEEELPELQTLHGVKAPQGQKWDAHNCPLRMMRNLRELDLGGIQAEHHRVALETALQEMHLLVSVTLRGDGLPSCVFTAENLRFLELIQLEGRVDWPTGQLNTHMLRPNLRHITLDPIEDVPPRIFAELFPGQERNYT